jgi:hypothetical protein
LRKGAKKDQNSQFTMQWELGQDGGKKLRKNKKRDNTEIWTRDGKEPRIREKYMLMFRTRKKNNRFTLTDLNAWLYSTVQYR